MVIKVNYGCETIILIFLSDYSKEHQNPQEVCGWADMVAIGGRCWGDADCVKSSCKGQTDDVMGYCCEGKYGYDQCGCGLFPSSFPQLQI